MSSNMIITRTSVALLALVGTVLVGCSSTDDDPVNIGDGDVAVDKNSLMSYAGRWDGYVEAYAFDSGTDGVHLQVDQNGEGILWIGEGEPLEPGVDASYGFSGTNAPLEAQLGTVFVDLIPYALANVRVESARVRMELNAREPMAEWCALQTPVLLPESDGVGVYGLAPSGLLQANEGGGCSVALPVRIPEGCYDSSCDPGDVVELAPVDCLAGSIGECCECDVDACQVRLNDDPSIVPAYYLLGSLDGVLGDSGEELTGTLLVGADLEEATSRTLHLTRAAQ